MVLQRTRWLLGLGLAGVAAAAWASLVPPKSPQPTYIPLKEVKRLAFSPGETLRFRFGWNGLPAAELWTQTSRQQAGQHRIIRQHGVLRTLPHVAWLYPVEDEVEALLDERTLEPRHYRFLQNENGRRTETIVWIEGDAFVGKRIVRGTVFPVQATREGSYDPVTFAYLARSVPLEPGNAYDFLVFDGKYHHRVTFHVETREIVNVAAGRFAALRIRPTIENLTRSGLPRKMKAARLWVSDDDRRIPVKAWSEVFFGRVYGELVEVQTANAGVP